MTMQTRRYRLTRTGQLNAITPSNALVEDPSPHEVLVRIEAASLNYRDQLILRDQNANQEGLTPLSDGAGTVIAIGKNVRRWKVGDRVATSFFPNWHKGAFSPTYLSKALGGGQTHGVLATALLAHESSIVEVPSHMSMQEAATLPCAGVTAWHALFERGSIRPGDTVLVQGTGGVALFGLQLATAHGAQVIVTSSSDEKLNRARALGAWQTINYLKNPHWDQIALDMTNGGGVDHILELGGPDTYDRSISAISSGGQIAQIGVLTGFEARPNLTPLQFKNATINGICVGSVEHFERLNEFVAQHRLHPVIDRQFGFDEATEAFSYLSGKGHFGKVVIDLTI